jgi:hypothetical protein
MAPAMQTKPNSNTQNQAKNILQNSKLDSSPAKYLKV